MEEARHLTVDLSVLLENRCQYFHFPSERLKLGEVSNQRVPSLLLGLCSKVVFLQDLLRAGKGSTLLVTAGNDFLKAEYYPKTNKNKPPLHVLIGEGKQGPRFECKGLCCRWLCWPSQGLACVRVTFPSRRRVLGRQLVGREGLVLLILSKLSARGAGARSLRPVAAQHMAVGA